MVMRVNTEVNTFTRITQIQWLQDKLALSKAVLDEQVTYLAEISHRTLKGLTQSINPDRPPKNYKDASSREDKQEWAEAYDKEYRGFMERDAFKVVHPEKGIKIHDTLTRLEYKEDNRVFIKRKVCLCARGISKWKVKVFVHQIYMLLLSRRQKQDSWQQSQRNTVARY